MQNSIQGVSQAHNQTVLWGFETVLLVPPCHLLLLFFVFDIALVVVIRKMFSCLLANLVSKLDQLDMCFGQ